MGRKGVLEKTVQREMYQGPRTIGKIKCGEPEV